jgi:hypothetical protein
MANVSMPQIAGGYAKAGIRAGFQPGAGSVANATTGVAMGNSPLVPVFVPYGQTWPRG